jgi:signal transduction histidine kinase
LRAYALLIAVAVLTAFAAGALFLTAAHGLRPVEGVNLALTRAQFESGRVPELTLDFGALVPRIEGAQLLDPEAALPSSQRYSRDELRALVAYARACGPAPAVSGELSKTLAWHRFECGQGELPVDFFEAPPFMHPGGMSFVALGAERFGREWLAEHQRFLHITEWRWGVTNPARELLASAGRSALAAFAAADPLVLDAQHVFIAHGETRPSYSVYARREWDAFIVDAPLLARVAAERDACVVREGRVCWARNDAPFFARLGRLTVSLLGLSLASAAVAAGLLVRRVRAQRQEEERQRFVLQTLTHELRTPVASLLVSIDSLRAGFDALSPGGQEALLRVVDDAQRLRRLTEKSRAYLTRKETLMLEPVGLPSVGDWVRERLGPSVGVEVQQDGPVTVDPYWLGLCLDNLVQNALNHGAPPVVVRVCRGERLTLEVRDGGTLGASRSPGLGLGLSIVRRAVAAMNGSLGRFEKPTRFIIDVAARRGESGRRRS